MSEKCVYCNSHKNLELYMIGRKDKVTKFMIDNYQLDNCYEIRCNNCQFFSKWDVNNDDTEIIYSGINNRMGDSLSIRSEDKLYHARTGNKRIDSVLDKYGLLDFGGKYVKTNREHVKNKTPHSDNDGGRKLLRDARDKYYIAKVNLFTNPDY